MILRQGQGKRLFYERSVLLRYMARVKNGLLTQPIGQENYLDTLHLEHCPRARSSKKEAGPNVDSPEGSIVALVIDGMGLLYFHKFSLVEPGHSPLAVTLANAGIFDYRLIGQTAKLTQGSSTKDNKELSSIHRGRSCGILYLCNQPM
jgi:hypothetical protein